jgi:hypothetical protein
MIHGRAKHAARILRIEAVRGRTSFFIGASGYERLDTQALALFLELPGGEPPAVFLESRESFLRSTARESPASNFDELTLVGEL